MVLGASVDTTLALAVVIASAAVTVIVAAITSLTGLRQQRAALVHERERQDRELRAAAERQADSRTHDRQLADLGVLRAVLDEATLVIARGQAAWREARELLEPRSADESEVEGRKRAHDAWELLEAVSRDVPPVLARLYVLVGVTHSISEAFDKFRFALLSMSSTASSLAADPATEKTRAAEGSRQSPDEQWRRMFLAVVEFHQAALERAGAMTP